jgi:AAA ATPase-like protein
MAFEVEVRHRCGVTHAIGNNQAQPHRDGVALRHGGTMSSVARQGSSGLRAAPTVADRLKRARRRRFVGRAAELELFLDGLSASEPPFSVLWIHGPGGVGKTALLGALGEAAADAGVGVVSLDLRAIEPSPPTFMAELERALGLPAEASVRESLAGRECAVLLLDTFETAVGLEDWLREQFVPALPARALVVVAGRNGPGVAWRRDPGWGDLLRVVSLRNLGPDDARAVLRGAGVAEEQHAWMLEFSHGHPLALSLLVDVLSQRQADADVGPLELGAPPDVVGQLVESFLAGVPSPRHRLALDCVAHVRLTTAGLLGTVFGDREGEELFSWLRELSFMEYGPYGLFPHDLVREVIDADLRWRDPAAYREMHAQVRRHLVKRSSGSDGREHERAVADLMFLHRANPAASALWDWKSLGEVYEDGLRDGDVEAIVTMVERHEGVDSAAIANHWLQRQPAGFRVFRGRGLELLGFAAHIALHEAREADFARDPGAAAVWAHAQRHAPPRPGDEVLVCRFLIDRDVYQAPSRSFNVETIRSAREWLGRARLSWYYIVTGDPKAMASPMDYIYFDRAAEADFEVGGRNYGVFAHDWRRFGSAEWLKRMTERELGDDAPEPDSARETTPELALSQPEFADAVRRALRDLHHPGALARNPLARTRVVRERGAELPAPEGLRELLREALDALRADPRGEKLVRALERTYMRPAPTQEAAAELLDLPFSTYRGHLTRGQQRLVDWLWQRELDGAGAVSRPHRSTAAEQKLGRSSSGISAAARPILRSDPLAGR